VAVIYRRTKDRLKCAQNVVFHLLKAFIGAKVHNQIFTNMCERYISLGDLARENASLPHYKRLLLDMRWHPAYTPAYHDTATRHSLFVGER